MAAVIVAVGALIALVSVVALLGPNALTSVARNLVVSTGLRVFAALVRIALGVAFIVAAPHVSMTVVLQAFGALLIFIGVVILFVSNEQMQSLVDWALGLGSGAIRIAGVVGLGLGAFLVYAGL